MTTRGIDLRLLLLLKPFTEIKFYAQDPFEELFRYRRDPPQFEKYFKKLFKKTCINANIRYLLNNLDEVELILRKHYSRECFNKSNFQTLSDFYIKHLKNIAKVFLTHRNGNVSLKYWESQSNKEEDKILGPYKGLNKVLAWNSLTRIMPTDLLAIIYLLSNQMDQAIFLKGYKSYISLEDPQLHQILSKGLADTHLHLKAAGSFDLLWHKLMSPSKFKDYEKQIKKLSLEEPVWDGIDAIIVVPLMAIIRILMARFLSSNTEKSFWEYYVPLNPKFPELLKAIDSVYNGIKEPTINSLHFLKEIVIMWRLTPSRWVNNELSETGQQLKYNDFIYPYTSSDIEYTTTENSFLFQSLKYIGNKGQYDLYYSKLFWQYIRVKNTAFQLTVENKRTRGLEYFSSYFDRATDIMIRKDNLKEEYKLLLHYQLQNPYLRKLEVRIGIGDNFKKIRYVLMRKLLALLEAYLHILKEL